MGSILPSASTILASSTQASTDTFTYLFPVVGLVLGFLIGVYVVNKLITIANKAARRVVGRGKRG